MTEAVHAWDLGGANVKLACAKASGEIDHVSQQALALWKDGEMFTDCVRAMLEAAPQRSIQHVITMTGELADCFPDRRTGVQSLLTQFCEAVETRDVRVFAGSAGLLSPELAVERYIQTASANWLASAVCVQALAGEALFVDMGTTTTDICPITTATEIQADTDAQRLRSEALLYVGAVRTPLSNIVECLPLRGQWQNLMNEYFANIGDILNLSGDITPEELAPWTADGGPADQGSSRRRVARMLGFDVQDLTPREYEVITQFVLERLLGRVMDSIMLQMSLNKVKPEILIVAGTGKTLLARLASRLSLPCKEFGAFFHSPDMSLNAQITDCAPVAALTWMYQRDAI